MNACFEEIMDVRSLSEEDILLEVTIAHISSENIRQAILITNEKFPLQSYEVSLIRVIIYSYFIILLLIAQNYTVGAY